MRTVEEISLAHFRNKEIHTPPVKLGTMGQLVSFVALNNKVDRALRKLSKGWTIN